MQSEPFKRLYGTLDKNSNIDLKKLTILAKVLILVAWLDPGRASADGYITVLNIQTEICKNGGRIKIELSHKPTIRAAIKSICSLLFSRIFVWKMFCKLLSKYFFKKFHAFSIFFWTSLTGCVFSMKVFYLGGSHFRHSNIQALKASLKRFLMATHLKWKLQVLFR